MNDPSVEAFEKALCEYTGAPYAVAMKRCCIALKGCCEYFGVKEVSIPRRTYEFVVGTLVRSGILVKFDDRIWSGGYSLNPYPIWDFARRFRPDMHASGQHQCLSFHRSKILGESALMYPEIAINLLHRLYWRRTFYDKHFGPHPDLPNSDYPDLSLTDWNGVWREQQQK